MTWTGGPADSRASRGSVYGTPVVPEPVPGATPDARSETTGTYPVVPSAENDAAETTAILSVAISEGAPAADVGEDQSVVRNSAVMAVGSLISRVTGLLRTVAVGAAIGAAAVSDDYNISNMLPNMVYELLLGGVLASVLVPVLVRARKRDADRGQAYAQRLVTLAAAFLLAATAVAVLAAPLLASLFVGHTAGPDHSLVTKLNYLILPEIFFYGMAALLAAILNTRGHFAAPTFTPILNNIVVIATAALFTTLPYAGKGAGRVLGTDNVTAAQVLVLGVGTTLGIVVQMLGLLPSLRKVGYRWKWRFDWGKLHLRELGKISAWMLVYVAGSQVAVVVLTIISKRAGKDNGPGPAIFNNAYLIFMMVHGIVAVSIMTALMPRLAAAAADGRFRDLADQFSMGTRLSSVILIPATAAYIVLGQPLAVTLFQWRAYTHDEAMQTGTVIAVAAIGLVPFAISQMQLFAFYAMPDTKTPALLNLPVVAVRVLGYIVFYALLSAALVDAGLMMANTISFVFAMILGYVLLRRRIGRLGLGETSRALGRLVAAAVTAAIPAWFLVIICQHTLGTGKVGSAITLVGGGLLLIVVYVVAALLYRARDITNVVGMVRARVGR